jgi:hypothetical protein
VTDFKTPADAIKTIRGMRDDLRTLGTRVSQTPRDVAGTVTAAGAILLGSGFTVNRTGTGQYTITFDEAFADHPIVTFGAGITVANYAVKLTSRTAAVIAVNTLTIAASPANVDGEFSFCAKAAT